MSPMPTPYDSYSSGYDIINGRDARGSLEYMWGEFLQLTPVVADPAGLVAGDAGRIWYNSTDSQFKGWTGLAVVILG